MIQSQRGFTWLELLIALALVGLVALGLTEVYLNVHRANVKQASLMDVQERGRFLMGQLLQRVTQAGSHHCVSSAAYDDRLAIRMLNASEARKIWGVTLARGEALLLSACEESLDHKSFTTVLYYLAKTSRRQADGRAVISLYRKVWQQRAQEWVPDVVDWQWRFAASNAEHTATRPLQEAKSVARWQEVRAASWQVFLGVSLSEKAAVRAAQVWHAYAAIQSRLVAHD